ncbi:MAG: hypothetical protein ABSH38_14495 [Verrucomicrobiota bacterium]|jgi:sugar lactone lactonase YvrE
MSQHLYPSFGLSAGHRRLLGIVALTLLAAGAQAQFVATVVSSNLFEPNSVAVDINGNAYLTDASDNRIVKFIPSSGVASTLAGVSGQFSYGTNDGLGSAARFNQPLGIVAVSSGLVVVDQGNQELRFVSFAGAVSHFAGVAGVAGTNDGPGATANFNYPSGIASDGQGNFYVADQGNNLIRKIDSSTNVTTVSVTNGYQFNEPTGVAVDNNSNIWVADTGNNVICMISNQAVAVIAGTSGVSGFDDSTTASSALFSGPTGLLWVPVGPSLLIADTGNNVLRSLFLTNATGSVGYAVQTVVGVAGQAHLVDGAPGTAEFVAPVGLSVDPYDSGFYVVDRGANALRTYQPNAPQPQVSTPQIGYVSYPATAIPAYSSVFIPSTGATFNNLTNIVVNAETGTQTYVSYGQTGSAIPLPGPGSTQPLIYPGDGSTASQVAGSALVFGAGTNDITIYAVGEANGRRASAVASARFQFITANPVITGDNAAGILLTDSTVGSSLYYTTGASAPTNDGSSPGVASGTSLSLDITSNVTLQVRAFAAGMAASQVVSNQFSVSNVVGNQLTWGFSSGPVSTHFITALNLLFDAPVTFTELAGSLEIYTLQLDLTVTNNGATPPPALTPANFASDLLQPIPNVPNAYKPIPPGMFINGVTNAGVIDTQPNTLEIFWLVTPAVSNLYTSAELLQFSGAAQTLFDLDTVGVAVVGDLSFVVPAGATPGAPYTLQIRYPSASSYYAPQIGGPPINVFVQAPTNGPLTNTGLNSVKLVTVLSNNSPASAHLVGDVFPYTWYNIGDFGDGFLLNDDVIETMEYAGTRGFANNPFYDAMDSSDGTVNNYYTATDSTIDTITTGDGVINVDDVYVTLRRSLDPSLLNYQRIWSGSAWVPAVYTNSVQLSAKSSSPSRPPVKMALNGPRYITVAADQVQSGGNLTAQVPIRVLAADTLPVRVFMLNVDIEPLDGSPAVAGAVSFSPAAGLGAPWAITSTGLNNYSAAWLDSTVTGVSGTNVIGTLSIPLPSNATANSAYRVHFNHFSASPNGLALFHATVQDGLITVGDRSGSSWRDGIPDTWRLLYFGTISNALSAANADPDGDGASNWQEYVAGTNPLDATSVFQFLPASAPAGGSFTLQWPSVVNKHYTVQSAPSLFGGWTTLATNLPGNGQTLQWTDSSAAAGARYYRALVQ